MEAVAALQDPLLGRRKEADERRPPSPVALAYGASPPRVVDRAWNGGGGGRLLRCLLVAPFTLLFRLLGSRLFLLVLLLFPFLLLDFYKGPGLDEQPVPFCLPPFREAVVAVAGLAPLARQKVGLPALPTLVPPDAVGEAARARHYILAALRAVLLIFYVGVDKSF